MYRIPIYKIHLVKENNHRTETKKITGSPVAGKILQEYLQNLDRENLVVMVLDTKNNIIGINQVSIGSLNQTMVHPREIFKPAILLNANAIILGHNHPSGDTTPSKEDHAATKLIKEAGELLQIKLIDHIITGDNYYSFAEAGEL